MKTSLCHVLLFCLLACAWAPKRFNNELSYRSAGKKSKTNEAEQALDEDDNFLDSSEPSSRSVVGSMFLQNKLSAKDVSAISNAHFREGNHAAFEWAKLGNWGQHPKNLARDLMRNLLRQVSLPPLFYWKVPVWNLEQDCQEYVDLPFLLPHEVIHFLVEKHGASVCSEGSLMICLCNLLGLGAP